MRSGDRPETSSSLERARRINAACERFESAWRGSVRPAIEHALLEVPEHDRPELFRELLALELELRRDAGEAPGAGEYRARFPNWAGQVVDVFARAETDRAGTSVTQDRPSRADPDETVPFTPTPPGPERPCPGAIGRFGDYVLLEELARGGMGVVYKATQTSLKRTVALKMILSGQFASQRERDRFLREAELAANLDHPNIVPIHEVGQHDGHHYFSMKLIEGGSLSRQVKRLVDDPAAAARLLATVARAVDHAHRQGFLHCDLKPANILVDSHGQPHVTDFGLARRVAGEGNLTAPGALMGTPSYMAPEQASGERDELTPAADVYGLGAILYELLTGRAPFRAGTVMETVVLVLEREPPPPRQVRKGTPPELETICLKCLEKSPRDRYTSAGELAENLDRYLRGEDVAGNGMRHRLRRWTRREPELVSRLAGLAIVAALTQFNYLNTPRPSPGVHAMVMTTLALWAVASLGFQALLRRGWRAEGVRVVWAATDMVLVTWLLRILEAVETSLLVGYPLLIAASGLWFRTRLVWFTTALAELGYLALYLDRWRHHAGTWRPAQYPNIFMAALAVMGFVVARQVKRIWALSTYYEHRPMT